MMVKKLKRLSLNPWLLLPSFGVTVMMSQDQLPSFLSWISTVSGKIVVLYEPLEDNVCQEPSIKTK